MRRPHLYDGKDVARSREFLNGEFKLPACAKLTKKVERAAAELGRLTRHASERRLAILSNDWEATGAAAFGLHNIYNGI